MFLWEIRYNPVLLITTVAGRFHFYLFPLIVYLGAKQSRILSGIINGKMQGDEIAYPFFLTNS